MGAHKKTADKKLALKRKLQTTKRTAHVGKTTHDELKARRKQMKHLKAALAPSYASTKHTAGRRDVRMALDRSLLEDKDLSERLRGTAPIPTNAQLLNKAKGGARGHGAGIREPAEGTEYNCR
ncbi:hypothetical protein DL89DRAFT_295643 [Linderina pennispora]|uniref:Uncharacterized protein n=1 Tax=Linderina pennispora TaxID=61395 RepID=A0A1Y1VXY8_9FUNG|nr:uncharacterized protein DL89DRAFT_295643 [Linderina pennispora]ORX66142.1 hypothetical protein DL89DRAFT_295643 [Linderina pennispora]